MTEEQKTDLEVEKVAEVTETIEEPAKVEEPVEEVKEAEPKVEEPEVVENTEVKDLKADVKDLKKELAEVKSLLEKPVKKSKIDLVDKTKDFENSSISPLDLI